MKFSKLNIFRKSEAELEKQKIKEWADETQSNIDYIESIKKIETASDSMRSYRGYDEDVAYQNIFGKSRNRKLYTKSMWYAAASVILVLAACTLWFIGSENQKDISIVYQTNQSIDEIKLEDGTVMTLDAGSKAIVKRRNVELEGRAYFHVKKSIPGDRFVVKFGKGEVEVYGTEFNVTAMANTKEVAVNEGYVLFSYNNENTSLIAGEKAEVSPTGQLIKTEGNVNPSFAWKKRELLLHDTPLKEAVELMSQYFKSKIVINNSNIGKDACKVTTKFTTESVEEALKEITTLLNLKYHKEASRYVITGSKC
jgi:ferric-dicitrate binding protein FerR (iron transport regulator)